MVIDCPICKTKEAIRVYENNDSFEVDCWECGFSTSFYKSLVEDDEAYNYYKTLVENNCVDMSLNGRLHTKTVFAVLTSIRGDNMWDYIPKLPDVINVGLCPNCGGEISAKHYPWDAEYRVNCYACGFKTSIHEDTVFERVKENMSA
jgi:Zn ribbon nucleic-acid-binding protein